MTDYAKFTVANLKDECKTRGLSLTGLKLKQQYIDKLEEDDASKTASGADGKEVNAIEQELVEAPKVEEKAVETNDSQGDGGHNQDPVKAKVNGAQEHVDKVDAGEEKDYDVPMSEPELGNADQNDRVQKVETNGHPVGGTDQPAEPVTEDTRADEATLVHTVEAEQEQKDAIELFAGQPPKAEVMDAAAKQAQVPDVPSEKEAVADTELPDAPAPQAPASGVQQDPPEAPTLPEDAKSKLSTDDLTQVAPEEVAEDLRKRKRRNVTPAPTEEQIALKKARARDGTPIVTRREAESLEQMRDAAEEAKSIRVGEGPEATQTLPISSGIISKPANTEEGEATAKTTEFTAPAQQPPKQQRQYSASPEPALDVSPALHPATASLYIRNFKRPLHLPTLKSHIASLASQSDGTTDPIKLFYLDSIRTHAFVTFTSASAATRVRHAMHGTRYPDDKERELLWCDFIPDRVVEEWIDIESGGGDRLGGGRAGRRWEVVYTEEEGDVIAKLVDAEYARRNPGLAVLSKSSGVRQSVDTGRPSAISAPSGPAAVHPDRANLVPLSPLATRSTQALPRRQSSTTAPAPAPPAEPPSQQPHDSNAQNFQPLDALFVSTTAKPKLYYKPCAPEVVDARMGMVKNLRIGHQGMGRSGDEGMKRFTFERVAGGPREVGGGDRGKSASREQWVDKGPEFGRGRRGLEMMEGGGHSAGPPRGGYRGGGGGGYRGNGYRGDGYRGAGGVGGGYRGRGGRGGGGGGFGADTWRR